jgi:hypothetical protein
VRARHRRTHLHIGARDRVAAVEVVQPDDDRAVEALATGLRGYARLRLPAFVRSGRSRTKSGEQQGKQHD